MKKQDETFFYKNRHLTIFRDVLKNKMMFFTFFVVYTRDTEKRDFFFSLKTQSLLK